MPERSIKLVSFGNHERRDERLNDRKQQLDVN